MTTSPSRDTPTQRSPRYLTPRLSTHLGRAASAIALACLALPLDGCAVVAFPCRVASATLKIVPLVGHPAAVPFDACAAAVD
ncbi:hypothetical protein LMG27952_02778 [Paraburkholderia hiiakae]|uniref:Lipoprotein n=1 Tax=Paraburkholderia hiiakae TaxID=1081782 RepID=A0ABN7HV67_9BURK|nr:hypothetical protein LMG27952_02778 [Paraburkholderia hiiakae]